MADTAPTPKPTDKKRQALWIALTIAIILVVVGIIVFRSRKEQSFGGQTCGGIAGIECPIGTTCILEDESVPDSTGTCVEISAP